MKFLCMRRSQSQLKCILLYACCMLLYTIVYYCILLYVLVCSCILLYCSCLLTTKEPRLGIQKRAYYCAAILLSISRSKWSYWNFISVTYGLPLGAQLTMSGLYLHGNLYSRHALVFFFTVHCRRDLTVMVRL